MRTPKQFIHLAFCLITSIAVADSDTTDGRSVADIQSMTIRTDGKYDVVCKNGTHEVVTIAEVQANHVCGGTSPQDPNIVAAFARTDGKFFALCKRMTWEIATDQTILQGKACSAPPTDQIVPREGIYKRESGAALKAQYQWLFINNVTAEAPLPSIEASDMFPDGEIYRHFPLRCFNKICAGNDGARIFLLDETHYIWSAYPHTSDHETVFVFDHGRIQTSEQQEVLVP